MITLRVGKEEYKAEKFVKGNDYIIGYTKGQEVVSFRGVKDFSDFKLLYGAKFEEPELTVLEKHIIQQAKKDAEMMEMVSELMMPITMKGLK
ncbi:hypothetical protein [Lysinibacillus sp. NPDC086135]|uniref:hypothetical protein n=1 Tax=Lysinibacillus sp. NPDC086135 TaxID=3364130 RepID=UPI0037F4B5D8